ncbi:MAG: Nif3-like dinuclear metal center hexameric protein [Firmicutes bacterium]|nr:Nif3-like dinuclear metal center hexameric protein [Bacillota bacterium]
MRVKDVLKILNNWAPPQAAADWDNVGLLVGERDATVTKILVALDMGEATLEAAIEEGADLVVTHHPLIFKPLKSVTGENRVGRLILDAARNRINLIAVHTNLDVAEGGVSHLLAERLGLSNHKVLVETYAEKLYKLAVMVPQEHQDQVRDAICEAGAGFMGNYSHCTFSYSGTGTFQPREGANPYIGSVNRLERVSEVKVESIVPEPLIPKVLNSMLEAHPYEEVAYDLFPLANKGSRLGLGRIGKLEVAVGVEKFLVMVKKALDCGFLRVAGSFPEKIQTVAVLCGSGAEFISSAAKAGADVYITADVKYHQAQEAEFLGLLVVDPGHDVMEFPIVPALAEFLINQDRIQAEGVPVVTYLPAKPVFSVF